MFVGALDKKSNRRRIARNLQWKLKYGTKNAFCHVKVSIILAQSIHYSLRHRNRHSSLLKKFSRTSYHLANNFIYQKPNYHFLADEEASICLYQIQKISLPRGQLFLSTLVPKYPRKNAYVNVQLVT